MNNSLLHLTYREMRETYLQPRPLGILGLVGLVLGLSGPFQTFELLEPVQRVIYWTVICGLTFGAGQFAGGYMLHFAERRKWSVSWKVPACGVAAGITVWPIVVLINWITFGPEVLGLIDTASLLVYCILIATVVVLASVLVQPRKANVSGTAGVPKIVSRLPLDLRGTLFSLSVQDHYVEVATSNGAGLVHFRLLDAIDDCDGVEGLQIHRSHWVALAGIKSVFRRDGKVIVETVRGDMLPVSRTYLPKIKELGLLV